MPLLPGDHVTADTGTGFVHTAPGHGQEDFIVGQKYGLDVLNPIDGRGIFLPSTEIFAGQYIWKANDTITALLAERGVLLASEKLTHSYPHCWRHKTPVAFRATPQWFISMEQAHLRRDALAAMICIRFSIISKWAEKNRISFTTYTDLASRPEVYALLRKEVETVNATLPPAQRISRFLLLYKELDADDGELTRTRKVRRSVINEKYADIIDAIYGGKRDIPVDTVIRFQDGTTQRIRTTLKVVDLGRDAPLAEAAE